jgi:hypothetical protein
MRIASVHRGLALAKRRSVRVAATTLALTAVVTPTVLSTGGSRASGSSPGCSAGPATSTSGSSFSATETLCRTFFDQGVVDVRQFSVSVSDTTELRNNQVVSVTWSGAHPSGGIVSTPQFATAPGLPPAQNQEYPVVLMECRGTPQQVSPATCWTATPSERIISPGGGVTPMWSLDANNASDGICQQRFCNVPLPLPSKCVGVVAPGPNYWVPFAAADGANYAVGAQGCAGAPPEMLLTGEEPTIIPSDTTYASTGLDGTGSDKFTITTSETNASVGCSQTSACSLVIVPIEGINCSSNPQASGPSYQCESLGTFPEGSLNTGGNPDPPAQAVTGAYWWSGSNWDHRISVPLNFATPADACANTNGKPLQFYGSEVMSQAAQQWDPAFCLNAKLFNIQQVLLSEPAAKSNLQQGGIEAAIQGEPPPVPAGQKSFFSTPTVQAPIAVSGFAIAYVIDNGDGTPYTHLNLDPRLLAKLLTESYSGGNDIQADWATTGAPPGTQPGQCPANCNAAYAAMANNPQSVFDDPEFVALNPGLRVPNGIQPAPAATLFSILAQADTMWAVTSYINSDPEARAWLNGTPDPWGMVVNPAYKGISLPIESWPLLDTTTNGPDYTSSGNPFCLGALGTGPAKQPFRPLIDSPQETLANVAYNMQYAIAPSLIACNNNPQTPEYTALGPETLGTRFLIGLVSLPAAEVLDLDTASLQTFASPEKETNNSTQFASGRVFQPPTGATLQAAATLMQPDPQLGSWVLPYSDYPSKAVAKGTYPGTMLLSADVPTRGLPPADATNYGKYLTFAATTGQTPGFDVGQLPAGYLPMTAANGLSAEVAYTEAAAADVAAQNGQTPGVSTGGGSPAPNNTTATHGKTGGSGHGNTAPGGSSGGSGSGSNSSSSNIGNQPGSKTSPGSGTGGSGGSDAQEIQPAAASGKAGTTGTLGTGLGGLALPLALLVALVGGGVAAVSYERRRRARS